VTPISAAADTVAATGAAVAAVATGAISPEEGQAVAGVIEFQRRAIETNDLAARIEALERGAGGPWVCRPGSPNSNGRRRRRPQHQNKSTSSWRGYRNCKRERSVSPGCKRHVDALFAFIDSIQIDWPLNR
jgi:hypothetical protein